MKTLKMIIIDPLGVHAGPASAIVNFAKRFKCKLKMKYNNKILEMRSIMSVIYLAIAKDEVIEIIADGEDEIEAIDGYKVMLENLKIAKKC